MTDLHNTTAWAILARAIAELDLVAHGTTQNFNPQPVTSEGDDQGGNRPRGGATDDTLRRWENGSAPDVVVLRSADHFRRRAQGCKTEEDARAVAEDALSALKSYRKTPVPSEPTLDHPLWKLWVSKSPKSSADIAAHFGVSRQYVEKVRSGYRRAA